MFATDAGMTEKMVPDIGLSIMVANIMIPLSLKVCRKIYPSGFTLHGYVKFLKSDLIFVVSNYKMNAVCSILILHGVRLLYEGVEHILPPENIINGEEVNLLVKEIGNRFVMSEYSFIRLIKCNF